MESVCDEPVYLEANLVSLAERRIVPGSNENPRWFERAQTIIEKVTFNVSRCSI